MSPNRRASVVSGRSPPISVVAPEASGCLTRRPATCSSGDRKILFTGIKKLYWRLVARGVHATSLQLRLPKAESSQLMMVGGGSGFLLSFCTHDDRSKSMNSTAFSCAVKSRFWQ